ncbi:jacalin-related lectin 3-like [Triticum urartu]|uniref:jacalin-related lectin 3-like n=1 Tax=Triticum urartu TaxID=4572 RepID=UPI002044CD87|nr:jacalin-related lectin 3-like [Triticum urartu]
MKAVGPNATVDLEGLECTLCFSPLRPPVFQWETSDILHPHLLCSTCYVELPEKNKSGCTRCFAVERILQSIQVLCPYAEYGCTAKMPYHEMEEHEMKCMHAPCFTGSNEGQPMALHDGLPSDSYTFVIQNVSRINININNRESKKKHDKKSSTCDNQCSAGSVVKMGPCGGGGGKPWKMDMRGVNRIIKVVVRHGAAVDAMSVLYERDGQKEKTKLWGESGGKRSEICLEPGEHLTNIRGHYGFFNGWFVIRSLTFVSNCRTFGPYGEETGTAFKLPGAGGKILGFHGRSEGLLDALGTYVKMG